MSLFHNCDHTRCDAEIAYLREALGKEQHRNEELNKILAAMADPLAQARVAQVERSSKPQDRKEPERQAPARRSFSPGFLRRSDKHAQRPALDKPLTLPPPDPGQPAPFNRVEASFVRSD